MPATKKTASKNLARWTAKKPSETPQRHRFSLVSSSEFVILS